MKVLDSVAVDDYNNFSKLIINNEKKPVENNTIPLFLLLFTHKLLSFGMDFKKKISMKYMLLTQNPFYRSNLRS